MAIYAFKFYFDPRFRNLRLSPHVSKFSGKAAPGKVLSYHGHYYAVAQALHSDNSGYPLADKVTNVMLWDSSLLDDYFHLMREHNLPMPELDPLLEIEGYQITYGSGADSRPHLKTNRQDVFRVTNRTKGIANLDRVGREALVKTKHGIGLLLIKHVTFINNRAERPAIYRLPPVIAICDHGLSVPGRDKELV